MCRLLREDEVKAIQWEADKIKKDKEKVSFQLHKKEWECDSLKVERYGKLNALIRRIHSFSSLPPVTNVGQAWSD